MNNQLQNSFLFVIYIKQLPLSKATYNYSEQSEQLRLKVLAKGPNNNNLTLLRFKSTKHPSDYYSSTPNTKLQMVSFTTLFL